MSEIGCRVAELGHNDLFYVTGLILFRWVGTFPMFSRHYYEEQQLPFLNRRKDILSFLLLIQEGQLSVTGESMWTKYWLTA